MYSLHEQAGAPWGERIHLEEKAAFKRALETKKDRDIGTSGSRPGTGFGNLSPFYSAAPNESYVDGLPSLRRQVAPEGIYRDYRGASAEFGAIPAPIPGLKITRGQGRRTEHVRPDGRPAELPPSRAGLQPPTRSCLASRGGSSKAPSSRGRPFTGLTDSSWGSASKADLMEKVDRLAEELAMERESRMALERALSSDSGMKSASLPPRVFEQLSGDATKVMSGDPNSTMKRADVVRNHSHNFPVHENRTLRLALMSTNEREQFVRRLAEEKLAMRSGKAGTRSRLETEMLLRDDKGGDSGFPNYFKSHTNARRYNRHCNAIPAGQTPPTPLKPKSPFEECHLRGELRKANEKKSWKSLAGSM